jgi:lysozyme family protein
MDDDDIIDRVLQYEGGYVDNPNDKGGPTNFGITAVTLGNWRRLGRPATADEVRTMPRNEAREIYKARYIGTPGFEAIADGDLRMVVVDCGVLYGPKRAALWLQTALDVPADGEIGSGTQKALATCNAETVARKVLGYRYARIKERVEQDPSQMVFFRGWMNRTDGLLKLVEAA